jgi:hypothetical protein
LVADAENDQLTSTLVGIDSSSNAVANAAKLIQSDMSRNDLVCDLNYIIFTWRSHAALALMALMATSIRLP